MRPPIPRRIIAELTARAFGISHSEMISPCRKQHCSHARYACWYLVRKLRPDTSLPLAGRLTGGKDHTTVLNGLRRADEFLKSDVVFAARVEEAGKAIAEWHSGERLEPLPPPPAPIPAKTIETPPAAYFGAAKTLPSAPENAGGFEYDDWFRVSCRKSEERFLRIASAIHPERVLTPQKEAAE